MAKALTFFHPSKQLRKRRLTVDVKPDAISWSYGLNTANYSTYGGEVVQILSCYIDDLTIMGTTRSYHVLEEIYAYFIDYIQIATTNSGGASYDPRPIRVTYPHRDWTFDIHPKNVPKFIYGRDIVAPEWSVICAVAEPDQDMNAKVMDKAMMESVRSNGDIKLFGTVTGDIGYEPDDPFRTPFVTKKDPGSELRNAYGDLGDFYNSLIPSYLQGDFDELSANYSQPAFGKPTVGNQKPGANPGTAGAFKAAGGNK